MTQVQEITLTIGSSIDLLFPGSGSKDGFEHSTFKNIESSKMRSTLFQFEEVYWI